MSPQGLCSSWEHPCSRLPADNLPGTQKGLWGRQAGSGAEKVSGEGAGGPACPAPPPPHPMQLTGTGSKTGLQEEFPESRCSPNPTTKPHSRRTVLGWQVCPLGCPSRTLPFLGWPGPPSCESQQAWAIHPAGVLGREKPMWGDPKGHTLPSRGQASPDLAQRPGGGQKIQAF